MNNDLKIIKKKYGEAMMHFCRDHFSSLLEKEGLLSNLLLNHFNPSHTLYEDIKKEELEGDFKNYIYSLIDVENNNTTTVDKTPVELMDEAGYILTECKTEKEVQEFRKYYREDEELCTFWTHRLYRCRVFFAVKKDVDKIKREDFKNPNRQDEYGISVISIQFTKDGTNTLSIKNRYNHTVNNPDATFSNNLDNIIPGLTESFEREYGIIQKYKSSNFEIPYYTQAEGKYYKFNYEIGNIYYCPNNIIIENFGAKQFPKERYIIFDYFILDLVNKKVFLYDFMDESFQDTIGNIEKIRIENRKDYKDIYLTPDEGEDIVIILNKENKMVGYKNNNVEEIEDQFLDVNYTLTELELMNVRKIRHDFLNNNEILKTISLPNVEVIGDDFLYSNKVLTELSLPKLKKVGSDFLNLNPTLSRLFLPNLESATFGFLSYNKMLKELNLPKLEEVYDDFLSYNNSLITVDLPMLKRAGTYFLACNNTLKTLFLPRLEIAGDLFLLECNSIEELILPNLIKARDGFMFKNINLRKLSLPKLEEVGYQFLCNNIELLELNLPNLKTAGQKFLYSNEKLEKIDILETAFFGPGLSSNLENLLKNQKVKQKKIQGDVYCEK